MDARGVEMAANGDLSRRGPALAYTLRHKLQQMMQGKGNLSADKLIARLDGEKSEVAFGWGPAC